jgi:E3 ubiquitin-protein ligase RNF14
MWEEFGHSQVVFAYIDHLQQSAENAFGMVADGETLEILQDYKISLLDYDVKATQAAFEKETFDCSVCLDPKKGSLCHKMSDCEHIFCVRCLQDFYNNAINEGDLVSVRCLAPNCAKKRAEAQGTTKKNRKTKTQLSPSELLQIPLEHDVVTRYVKLKHKAGLESDKNTVYCPRKWCQGAARSKKHRKPEGLEMIDSSDDESDTEGKGYIARKDLIAICEDCVFAFCSRCYQGWHGEFTLCTPKTNTCELTEEDNASLEYLKLYTTPCPTCAAPAQKTHGCNHMICFKCNTHFCYLCSAWLEPSNPYKHYNLETIDCYMRLWEFEGGDGDDVGIGYGGGVGGLYREELDNHGIEALRPEADHRDDDEEARQDFFARIRDIMVGDGIFDIEEWDSEEEQQVPDAAPQLLDREGPLVLRINQLPPPPVPAAPAVPDAPQQPRRNRGPLARRQARPGEYQERLVGQRHAAVIDAQRPPPRRRLQRQQEDQEQHQHAAIHAARNNVEVLPAEERGANQEAARRAWVQNFVQMALNDEEDQLDWDSDEEEDMGAWEIPVR